MHPCAFILYLCIAISFHIGNEIEETTPEETGANLNVTEAANYDHSQGKPRCTPINSMSPFCFNHN